MKSFLSSLALPLMVFSLVATGCSKTTDLSNKSQVTVNLVRTNPDPNAPQIGTEITLVRHEGGDRFTNFALVPSSLTFKDLKPGTYSVSGKNSNSDENVTVQVDANEQEVVQLSFSE